MGIPDSEGEKGVGGKLASKTSVSYAVPILTNFTGYTAFSLRRIEDQSGNTGLLLVQSGACSWCLPKELSPISLRGPIVIVLDGASDGVPQLVFSGTKHRHNSATPVT